MIVDFRLRPPLGRFKDNFVFEDDFLSKYARDTGTETAESAKKRSITMLLDEMKRCDVQKAVIPFRKFSTNAAFSENIPNVYNNDDLAEILKYAPDKFIGMACVECVDGLEYMLKEIEKYVVHGDSQGVFFEPSIGVKPMFVNDKTLYELYEYCQSRDIPILFTFGGTGCSKPEYYEPAVIDRVAHDFPKLTMILSHGGWPHVREICSVACNRKNVFISPDLYFINGIGFQDYVQAANYRLQDQMIFGSAYPCVSVEEAIKFYKNSGIKEKLFEKIFYKNAMRALHLD